MKPFFPSASGKDRWALVPVNWGFFCSYPKEKRPWFFVVDGFCEPVVVASSFFAACSGKLSPAACSGSTGIVLPNYMAIIINHCKDPVKQPVKWKVSVLKDFCFGFSDVKSHPKK